MVVYDTTGHRLASVAPVGTVIESRSPATWPCSFGACAAAIRATTPRQKCSGATPPRRPSPISCRTAGGSCTPGSPPSSLFTSRAHRGSSGDLDRNAVRRLHRGQPRGLGGRHPGFTATHGADAARGNVVKALLVVVPLPLGLAATASARRSIRLFGRSRPTTAPDLRVRPGTGWRGSLRTGVSAYGAEHEADLGGHGPLQGLERCAAAVLAGNRVLWSFSTQAATAPSCNRRGVPDASPWRSRTSAAVCADGGDGHDLVGVAGGSPARRSPTAGSRRPALASRTGATRSRAARRHGRWGVACDVGAGTFLCVLLVGPRRSLRRRSSRSRRAGGRRARPRDHASRPVGAAGGGGRLR